MKSLLTTFLFLLSITIPAFAHAQTVDDGWMAYDAGDYERAKAVFLSLAEAGDAKAMNAIGFMYDEDKAFPRDHKLACDWYEKAALKNNSDAQFNFSHCFVSGGARRLNESKYLYWHSKSALQGDVTAQINLLIHFHDKDKVEARKWGQMAVDAGNRAARAGMWAYGIDYVGPPSSPIDKFCALVMVGLLDKPFSYCDSWP